MTSGQTASTTNRPRPLGRRHHVGRRAVGREHHRGTVGDIVDRVDEDHAEVPEAFHHEPVVDDLVVAVDGRLEDPDHPGQGLDGHLDAGAETTGAGQQDVLDFHSYEGIGSHPYTRLHVLAQSGQRRAGFAGGARRSPAGRRAADAQRRGPPRRHPVPGAGRRGGGRPRRPKRRPGKGCAGREAGRGAARRRGPQRPVRPGPDLRQPLPVLLHLPAAQGHAEEPLRQRRRLSPVISLRKLHNADPLHRGRSGTGDRRRASARCT